MIIYKMNTTNNNYLIKIFERYCDLKKSNKKELDNYDLSKIFEYFSCIKLSEELLRPFYEYDVRKPRFPTRTFLFKNNFIKRKVRVGNLGFLTLVLNILIVRHLKRKEIILLKDIKKEIFHF